MRMNTHALASQVTSKGPQLAWLRCSESKTAAALAWLIHPVSSASTGPPYGSCLLTFHRNAFLEGRVNAGKTILSTCDGFSKSPQRHGLSKDWWGAGFHFAQRSLGLPRACVLPSTSAEWSLVGRRSMNVYGVPTVDQTPQSCFGLSQTSPFKQVGPHVPGISCGCLGGCYRPGPLSPHTPPNLALAGLPDGISKDRKSFWPCPLLGAPGNSSAGHT